MSSPASAQRERDHVRVQLRATRLGVVEVTPRHEVDAPQTGVGGDGSENLGARLHDCARPSVTGREDGAPRVVSTHPVRLALRAPLTT